MQPIRPTQLSVAQSGSVNNHVRVGVFIDVENLGAFLKGGGAQQIIEWAAQHGKVVMRKAVGNFSIGGVHAHQKSLTENGFELLHVAPPVSGKSTADVRLAVEVMDMHTRLDAVVLATGDADLSHVCFKLREHSKFVVGVMPPSALSNIVKNSVDRLVMIGSTTHKQARQRAVAPVRIIAPAPHIIPLSSSESEEDESEKSRARTLAGKHGRRTSLKPASQGMQPQSRHKPGGALGKEADLRSRWPSCEDMSAGSGAGSSCDNMSAGSGAGSEASSEDEASNLLDDAMLSIDWRRLKFVGASILKDKMKALDPGFSEKRLGFARFEQYLMKSRAVRVTCVGGEHNKMWSPTGEFFGTITPSSPPSHNANERSTLHCAARRGRARAE